MGAIGTRNLTREQKVLKILRLRLSGATFQEIADYFGTSRQAIQQLWKYKLKFTK